MPEETETPAQTEDVATPAAAAPARAAKAATAAPAVAEDVAGRKNRKTREGLVVSDKMD
jgi:hypothetical protein